MTELKINPKFRDLIPPLSTDEYEQLEKNLLADGIREPLVVWGNALIDGHNRYRIALKHNLPFETVQKEFADEDEASIWIMQNQLGRRNLNDFVRVEMAYKCEDAVKAKAKEQQIRKSADSVLENLPEQKPMVSRNELGTMAGVSGKTYDHGVTVLKTAPQPVIEAAKKDEISINAAFEITKMPFAAQREIADRIEQGEKPKDVIAEVKSKPHVAFNSGNNEWYTPKEIIEAARKAMGSIDIDPASSDVANEVVKAAEYYTAETDGLDKPLHGNVWMNPPYASDLIGKFIQKIVSERNSYKQAIVLVNNATETEWFNSLISVASAVCFPRSRVKFYMPDGKTGSPLQGQAIVYIGDSMSNFLDNFSAIGWIGLVYGVQR